MTHDTAAKGEKNRNVRFENGFHRMNLELLSYVLLKDLIERKDKNQKERQAGGTVTVLKE